MAFEGTIDLFPEAAASREELVARARRIAWYHTLRLDPTLTTEGIFALDEFVPFYLLPGSLAGLDCLDVGTGNGYWAFELERRNARRVVATDIADYSATDFARLAGSPPVSAGPALPGAYGEPFRVAATLLASRVEYRIRSAYELGPTTVGTHDVVFCGSVLMHLFAPLLALQRMADVCRDTLVLTTQTAPELDGRPLSVFRGHEIPYVHYVPSPSCLVAMVRSCGYARVLRGPTFLLRFRDREANPDELPHTTVVAQKDPAASRVAIPEAPAGEPRQCRARVEIVSAPDSVPPGHEFDVVVRVANVGEAAWVGERGRPLGLDLDLRLARLGTPGSWEFASSGLPLLDYLPPGLSTLARLRVRAPGREGRLSIRPVVHQAGGRFPGDVAIASVAVAAGAPPLPREGRPHSGLEALRGRLRTTDGLLREWLAGHPGWSIRYERWRERVRRRLR
ncbi:MAG TPA: class I SAM-dependent methyltransferase [Vicinamibacteria bacterium]